MDASDMNCRDILESINDNNMNKAIATQVLESKLARCTFQDKGALTTFRNRAQKGDMESRAEKAVTAHDLILNEITSFTTKEEYSSIIKRVMQDIYREEFAGLFEGGFGGFNNPNQKVPETGLYEIQRLQSLFKEITEANFEFTASVIYRIQGQLARLDTSSDGARIKGCYNLKGRLEPFDFDFQSLGQKYNMSTNTALVWDLEKGVKPDPVEKLPEDYRKVIHERITRVGVDEFCTDWMIRSTFDLDINISIKYALVMTTEVFFVVNQLSRRDSFKFDYSGNPKPNFVMPDDLLINPGTPEGRERIFEISKSDSEYRGVYNKIELHRIKAENIGMQCNAVQEVFYHTELKREIIVDETGFQRNGKEYLFFNKTGSMGVGGDSGKAVGIGVCVVSGKGKGSKRAKQMSDKYRGRVTCESYLISCLADKKPIPAGANGNRIFKKVTMIEEGIKVLKEVESFEYQRLALMIDEDKISDDFKVGKEVQKFIEHAAYTIRGWNNMTGYDILDTEVEKSACFTWNKNNYLKNGRFELCSCENSCKGRWRLLQFIGLAINITFTINTAGYKLSTQQLVGSRLFKKFTETYCELDTVNGHLSYKFTKSRLPFQVPLSAYSKAIFEMDSIPVKIANRS